MGLYIALKPVPPPKLHLAFGGDGSGAIVDVEGNSLCEAPGTCSLPQTRGSAVVLRAKAADGSYFSSWSRECAADDPAGTCTFVLDESQAVTAWFEKVPTEVDVEWVAEGELEDQGEELAIALPDPKVEAEMLEEPIAMPEQVPPPPEPEPLPEQMPDIEPPKVAVVEPPPPPPQAQPQPQPPPPPPQEEQKEKPPEPPPKMKSVEVADDENVVEEAPDDAQFLSDKNRNVEEETHATETNLERAQKGEGRYSEKSDNQDEEIGAEEDEIAQLEETEASHLDAEREQETAHSGEEQVAKGIRVGEEGGGGQEGEGGDAGDGSEAGQLAMRGIAGRGAPGGPNLPMVDEDTPGGGGEKGRRGKQGKRGIKTDLSFEDYERIVGEDTADEEVAIARRRMSKKKGRYVRKIERMQSSLENFTPEIRPGNQTALKTRAEPFAVYVARMHRRIHELWGFGFIEELDSKSSTHEMNKWSLMTKIELVINPDGTVDKATIVEHSGVLTFDVAALDTLFTAEPFEATPTDIRSPDGKVYLHWRFHRDWRQCGTFGVDKFIRSDVPANHDHEDHQAGVLANPRRNRRARTGDAPVAGGQEGNPGAAARAAANMPAPDDPKAEKIALSWMSAFEAGQVGEMTNVSGTPFMSGGQIVANDKNTIAGVYGNIMREVRSRKIEDWRVLSGAGYRRMFDTLPPGAEGNPSHLYLVVRLASERFTLTLEQKPNGNYEIVAFDR